MPDDKPGLAPGFFVRADDRLGANFVTLATGCSWPVVRFRHQARELTFAAVSARFQPVGLE